MRHVIIGVIGLLLGLLAFSASAASGIKFGQSAAAESSDNISSGPVGMKALSVTATTAGYLMVFDANSAPVDGAVTPKLCWQMPAAGTMGADMTNLQAYFTTGITLVWSSTGCFTKTASATAMFMWQVQQ